MSAADRLELVVAELARNARLLDGAQLDELAGALLAARHVFVAGAGRSGVAIRGFANRLVHLGRSVSIVGDLTSPRSHPKDLLVIGSGSGETAGLVSLAARARELGVPVAVLTTAAGSTLARAADHRIVLPGVSKTDSGPGSGQPMGSAFEQLSGLVYDAIVLELMRRTGQSSADLYARHADLE